MHRIFFCVALLLPTIVSAAVTDDTWMSVLLDGRKIGAMHNTRKVEDDRVITSQTMDVQLDRAGTKIALASGETDTESSDGKPLAFESLTTISGTTNVLRGRRRADGQFDVETQVGGAKHSRVIAWPRGALLAEGMRLANLRAGLDAGTHYRELAFQPESLDAVEVQSTVGASEVVDLPDGRRTLTKIEQIVHLPEAQTSTVTWVDADLSVLKMTMPLMGYELTLLACSKACAQAPNQSADILTHAMMRAPSVLNAAERQHGVILSLSATTPGAPLKLADTDEQQATATAQGVELRIVPLTTNAMPAREDKPTATDSLPNDWLQSSAPEIVGLARRGVGQATRPREQMQNLEQFVRSYIRTKDLNVGYASALEVAKNPEGDCTEHAVLLAALGRAMGIPTRVVDGLVYADRYAGTEHVFVPHAWAQAFVDGHWQSFDAALHGFDAGHIALSVGDGDPWRFFAGFDTLGRMRVDAIDPLPAGEPLQMDAR
ncbi:MAG: transglutaminase-like domain-containing protein [Rudaea sp.]|nr:transglutaminase-like domain-containing protein [Rudaea sp.]